ncbi:sodium- and chloride-dependent glycine transporter 1-like [Mytilus galloprovincialis]|uniref:sodium- and chloride-dependent glycine transporter 1-like n=1 Tax=Mytilus galloprovincialis TaxID=29158 RepID=UPI003F7C9BB2
MPGSPILLSSAPLKLIDKESMMSNSSDSSEDENPERGNWGNKMEFVLSCLSYAVGLGNVWRFPYVCYRNGAGAFLIPFIIMLFITGIPLVFMELSLGQYCSSGIVTLWKASPIFQGVGWAMFVVSVLISVYYNMIIAYTLYFLFASFAKILPWSACGSWSTEVCNDGELFKIKACTKNGGEWCNGGCIANMTALNETYRMAISPNCSNFTSEIKSPSDEFFHEYVLGITDGVHEMGTIRWELVGCLALAWILVGLCLAKGIKSSGKAVYFTAFFPYVVLLILLVRGLTLEGSVDGIVYFLTPQWSQLSKAQVWADAAVQIFFSLSPCWGGLITLASYNKFRNNCFLDAIIVSVMDCVTSVFAGLVIFAIIGYMAHELNVKLDEVASEGAGLAFVVYPEVVTKLPISQLWSVLFFAMLITLGLGTQIATVTTVHTTLMDYWPHVFRVNQRRRMLLLVMIAVSCFLLGLAFCTQGGMFILQLFDNYAATYSLLLIGLVECIGIGWVYGADRFLGDIELMLGKRPSNIWKYSWKFVAPTALLAILIFSWADFKSSKYDKYVFPLWADGLGFIITLSSIVLIPAIAIYKVVCAKCTSGLGLVEVIKNLAKPADDWGPVSKEHRTERKMIDGTPTEQFESQIPFVGSQYSAEQDTKV